jgi:hypothetical protein
MGMELWLLLVIVPVLFIARRLVLRTKSTKDRPSDIYPIF